MVELPTKEDFLGQAGTRFTAKNGDEEPFEMTLDEVETVISNEKQECYSLNFSISPDTPPVQALYDLSHDELGDFALLLVPIKKKSGVIFFQAVFNNFVA